MRKGLTASARALSTCITRLAAHADTHQRPPLRLFEHGQLVRRPAVAPGQQVDLNVIPTELIDRVETISVGGAPIYGADAISGTVNIILKKISRAWTLTRRAAFPTKAMRGTGVCACWEGRTSRTDGATSLASPKSTKSRWTTSARRARSTRQDLQFESPAVPGKFQTVLISGGAVGGINYGGIPMVDDAVVYAPTGIGLPASPPGTYSITHSAGQLLGSGPAPTGSL